VRTEDRSRPISVHGPVPRPGAARAPIAQPVPIARLAPKAVRIACLIAFALVTAATFVVLPGGSARAAATAGPPTFPFPFAPFPSNPPGLPAPPTAGNPPPAGANPLAGDRFFVDPQSAAAKAAQRYPDLNVIAREPGTERFGSFSFGDNGVPSIQAAVSRYLTRAALQAPGTVPMIATYRVVDGHCGNWADPPADQAAYHNFIQGFAQGIGSSRAVLFLEMDSLITTPCLSPSGLDIRMNELSDAINVLTTNCPGLVIYLDAGAADALPAARTANLLKRAGVGRIQGFFLNATHFDWTANEIAYGERISRLTGGKHFVVNTGENGQGPLVPSNVAKDGNEVLCNPPGRGLGPLPTTSTGYPNADAFAWTSNPGESGGQCRPGAPPTGVFWPAYAATLVHNANFTVGHAPAARPPRRHATHRRKSSHVR
jgi:endoglucanase